MDKRSLDGFLPAPLKPKRQNIRAGDNTRYMHPRKLEMTSIASKFLVALSLFVIAILREDCAEAAQPSFEVTEVPSQLRKAEKLSDFYKKYVDVYGLPVIASEKASDMALAEAANIVYAMLKDRSDIRDAIIRNHVRVVVMAPTEKTTDIPEHSGMRPKEYWDMRARGLGATAARPASSCAEENLLNLSGDHYPNENILIHEFAHTIHIMGLKSIDPSFDSRLQAIYQHALAKGLWAHTYAATNYAEYWAETVQSYFDSNDANNAQHNDVNTHDKLAQYDPEVFALIDEVFRNSTWRYTRYDARHGKERRQPTQSVHIVIINNSVMDASIYWMAGGMPKLYRKLSPGQSYEQTSFTGHKWQAIFNGDKSAIDFVVPAQDTKWELH